MAKLTINKANRVLLDGKPTDFELTRGAYTSTTDDRLDRWYIERVDAEAVDRRGAGYSTRREALEAVRDLLLQVVY